MQRIVYDIVVIGGGIIGTSTARELLKRNPSLKLAIIEKEKKIAVHQSGHNSGVIHSGIYYKPGTLKAQLCVRGMDLTYDYCSRKKIPFKKCGKLIVAVSSNEVSRLDALYERAVENHAKGIALINDKEIKEIEPNIEGLKAIWSPNTGIVDWTEVARSFCAECQSRGADLYLNFPVERFRYISGTKKDHVIVSSKTKDIITNYAITCGGLYSDKLAMMTGCNPIPKIIPFRGDYLLLKPDKCHLVKTNIYPVPHPNLPFLGVHITPRIDGSVWLGPNAILSLKQEGYGRFDFKRREAMEIIGFKGLRKLAIKHAIYGAREVYRAFDTSAQIKQLQQYLPALTLSSVARGPSGVRAQAINNEGDLVDDFVFDTGDDNFSGRVLHVRNAPSPAATSSLAIAEHIADILEQKWTFNNNKSL